MIGIKTFNKDNTYTFDKGKFIKAKYENEVQYNTDEVVKSWVDKAHSKEVKVIHEYKGLVGNLLVLPEWCKCIRKNKQER